MTTMFAVIAMSMLAVICTTIIAYRHISGCLDRLEARIGGCVDRLGTRIDGMTARTGEPGGVGKSLNASLDNLEAEVRTLKQLLQQKGML